MLPTVSHQTSGYVNPMLADQIVEGSWRIAVRCTNPRDPNPQAVLLCRLVTGEEIIAAELHPEPICRIEGPCACENSLISAATRSMRAANVDDELHHANMQAEREFQRIRNVFDHMGLDPFAD